MTEVIYLDDRRHRVERETAPSPIPPQGTEADRQARRAALYDMLRILGRAVRTSEEMEMEQKTEFALAALKVLGPDWELSRSG
ncbi:MAG: hypothetical protein JSR91_27440 [Proteobacteria bacterium]|nr:hypothetical protein [Pseudomonadota bacterium]